MDSSYEGTRHARPVPHELIASVVSHDLRAPLRSIESLISFVLLDESSLAKSSVVHLEGARVRAGHLLTMLDGLLEFLRLAEDAPPVERVPIAEVVDGQLSLLLAADFSVDVAADLPTIVAPRPLVDSAIGNLLVNSIQHHDRGAGRVEVAHRVEDGWVVVTVADDGPGVPPGREVDIFRLFATGRPIDRSGPVGGVGLAIVARAMAAMAGEVHCIPTSGRGARFELRWPEAMCVPGRPS